MFGKLLQDTTSRLTTASVVPSDAAFAPSIQSLITAVVASTQQSSEEAYRAVFSLWTDAYSTISTQCADDQVEESSANNSNSSNSSSSSSSSGSTTTIIVYLHAVLLAMSALNNGTASTGEHMLTAVLIPLLNNKDLASVSLMPTCLSILADSCVRFPSQLTQFCDAVLARFSQDLVTADEDEFETTRIPWRNWSTSLLRVCDATAAAAATATIKTETETETEIAPPLHSFLRTKLLPQLCRCALTVNAEHARVGALRIFGSPTVRTLFGQEHAAMEKLWRQCIVLWKQDDILTKTRRVSYDVLAHTFELCDQAHLEEDMWTIILEGLIPSKEETVQKISLHLLHLACQRVYDDERWQQQMKDTMTKEEKTVMILKRQRWGRRMEQFRALYSVLDEFSHHLIDSMWPEMKSLYIQHQEEKDTTLTSESKHAETTGILSSSSPSPSSSSLVATFPPSFMIPDFRWTSILLQKAFKHDNPSVRATLIRQFLQFPFVKGVHSPVSPTFLRDVLLPALDWPMFYRRHVEGIQETLVTFMRSILMLAGSASEVGVYLRAYIKGLTRVANPYALACLLQVFVSLRDVDGLQSFCSGAFGSRELLLLRTIVSKNIDMNMSEHLVANGIVAAMTLCVDLSALHTTDGFVVVDMTAEDTPTTATTSTTSHHSNLIIIGEILGKFRPSMLCPGTTRHDSISSWLNKHHEWVISGLHQMLASMLHSPRTKHYNSNDYSSSKEWSLMWWCLSSSSHPSATNTSALDEVQQRNDALLSTLCFTLGTLYKNAYLEHGIVETALELYVDIIRFRRFSMLPGPEGPQSPMEIERNKEKKQEQKAEDLEETIEERKHRMYLKDLTRLQTMMQSVTSDMLSYCEMKCFKVEDALFTHDDILPLPLLTLRETSMLYLGDHAGPFPTPTPYKNVKNISLHTSVRRVLIRAIEHLQSKETTAEMEVISLRNLDALLDVTIRSVLFPNHDNEREGWSPDNILQLLISHDRTHITNLKHTRTTDTKMSMLVSIHVVHRWKCIDFILEGIKDISVIENKTICQLFEDASDIMDCVGIGCLPSVYSILRSLLSKYISIMKDTTDGDEKATKLQAHMRTLMKRSWECLVDFEYTKDVDYFYRMEEYLRFAFHRDMFCHFPEITEEWFVIVMRHRNMSNAMLLQRLVMICFEGCWSSNFTVALRYIPYICNELLLYQEPHTNHLHDTERVHYGPPPTSLVRVIVMWCLEREMILEQKDDDDDDIRSNERSFYLLSVLDTLLAMNFSQEWIEDYMPTSRVHRNKMRCWQALCVLSTSIVRTSATNTIKFQQYVQKTSEIVLQNNHATIRYYIELFLARLLTGGGPEHIRQHLDASLLKPLQVVEMSTKSIASMLVVILHSLNDIVSAFENEKGFEMKTKLVGAVLPLLGSSGSQTRILSQIIMHRIHPDDYVSNGNSKNSENDPLRSVLVPILTYLREQKDMIRMRKKQEKIFNAEVINTKCSMKGLLSTTMNSFGDFYDQPVIERVRIACAEYQKESELLHPERFYYRDKKEAKIWKQLSTQQSSSHPTKEVTGLVASAKSVEDVDDDHSFNFQQKIQPWSSFNLLNDETANVRSGDVSTDKKSVQKLIVIASLLDKIPNLGGLARTAEIFGASKLVIGNKNVLNNRLFQTVSVTAEKWIDIDECEPKDLYEYLCGLQEKGYSIVGVEQTSKSTSLEKYQFPTKTVLLLGREKTGIPSQFIHMLDHCVEIPQLGLIRSLNVHVSAAIMVWEYTRQQILLKE